MNAMFALLCFNVYAHQFFQPAVRGATRTNLAPAGQPHFAYVGSPYADSAYKTVKTGPGLSGVGALLVGVVAAAALRIKSGNVAVLAVSPPPSPNPIDDLVKSLTATKDRKPALGDVLPPCPETKWNEKDIDVDEWQAKYKAEELPECPLEIVATDADNAMGKEYFLQRREELEALLAKHGTLWLRNFDLMKDPEGFRTFWESLDLNPCLDPIHSSGLRKFLSKNDAVYEEVNKQSLSRHYIGLHQEMTEKKTAKTGAFVCFQPATVEGGQFFIADGERIFRDMDPDVLKNLIDRQVRISVSNLDLDPLTVLEGIGYKEKAMDSVRELVAEKVAPKFDMDLDMVWGTDGKEMRLQAIERAQSPVNRHPDTGRPIWFCNMHNHARFLRDRRYCNVPEVGMTDVYYGDLSQIDGDLFTKVNEACEKNIVRVPMQAGDVLLCDNYRVLHGRDVFVGDRLHAVSWFGEESTLPPAENRNDAIASFVNNFVVGN
jgi:hypothetical protein